MNEQLMMLLSQLTGGGSKGMVRDVGEPKSIDDIIKQADILVGAVGIPRFIKHEWIKDNAVVIDAGYHPEKCGDIDLKNIESKASAYTPVPGGVGPMTINTLILQTLQSAQKIKI